MILKLDQDFSSLNQYIEHLNPTKIFILVDDNTHENCLPILMANLETAIPYEIVEIEHGEENKNIGTASQLWEILAENNADRKALFINLGGGVITDMGGFVSSTYKRGIKFINIPTSLLAMCDASIGGKTGIDHLFLKNIVGTFAEPEHIFLYPSYIETLEFVEVRSGFAEMLKHGLIADQKHWQDLIAIKELTPISVEPFIERSMQIKQTIVEQDFKEQNIRKILNFGHTVGHAVESLFLKSDKIIPHGEAVAMGMICETKLAELEQLISPEISKEVIQNLQRFYPKLNIEAFSNQSIYALMINDKKNAHKNINYSLITAIGSCNYDYHASQEHLFLALDFYRNLEA